MTKKEWYEKNDNKKVYVKHECLDSIKARHLEMIKDYQKQVDGINKRYGKVVAEMKITDKAIQFNNGEFVMLPYKTLLKKNKGNIKINSKSIKMLNINFDKKNLKILNEKEFCFKSAPKLIYVID